jgi:tetratricopeptide (TPR) repeat protein
VLEAGERVCVDLLPENWVGLPPGLPPEVVAELAERARAAEEKLGQEARRIAEAAKPVVLRTAELPNVTRLVFEPPANTPIQVKEGEDGIEAVFTGHLTLDEAGSKPKTAAGVKGFAAGPGAKALTVKIDTLPGYKAHGFIEDGTLVVDLATPAAAKKTALPEPASAKRPPAPTAAASAAVPSVEAAAAPPATPSPAAAQAPPQAAVQPVLPPGLVTPTVEAQRESLSILFPFRNRTAAAAVESAGTLLVVFDTQDQLQTPVIPDAARGIAQIDAVRQEDRVAIVRLALPQTRALRFAPESNGWRLVIGAQDVLPPDPLKVARGADETGSGIITVAMPTASAAHWLRDGPAGERVAVVTAFGRPQALPKPMNFVEFGLPQTLQGLVVSARSDDLSVSLGSNGVTISRRAGLSLSTPEEGEGGNGRPGSDLVLARDTWREDQSGNVFARQNQLVGAATEAARAGRADIRYRQARLLVANGMNEEAVGILALARADDATFARRRDGVLLAGVASLRSGRFKEAGAFLGAESLADDREAILWRAVLDAKLRKWPQAVAGLRRSAGVLEMYPDDLAAAIRLVAIDAALQVGDVALADGHLSVLDRLPADMVPSEQHRLARTRVDEAAGRFDAAQEGYGHLVEDAGRRVWADASLRSAALAIKRGSGSPEDAIKRLETVAAVWRGDDIEIGALLELSRLYGKAGKWRDVFKVMRRANMSYPTSDLTRVLHDETALLFEKLFLGNLGDNLPAVEALGLFFDFREMAPVGRRGDEIVRRLADRLVDLDLLDQAAELLQHQVDKRLTGAARATVAARLAAVRLLAGKPTLALAALHETRLSGLPEEVRQFRLLLEAQTLADLSRTDLALESLEGETAPEFTRLRANILWSARRWRDAGEAAEALVGTRWQGPAPLSERDRSDVLRAAIAYSLADETIGLGRLRSKFAAKMADSPDANTFDMLLQPGASQTREFRAAAVKASRADALKELLADWKARHPGSADTLMNGAKPGQQAQTDAKGPGAPPS